MNDAYTRQVAGSHYVTMGIQPFQFAMRNGWDSAAFSILKYISRHRTKNGKVDLEKSRHIIDIRQAEIEHILPNRRVIAMGEYIRSNRLCDQDAWALLTLESWVDQRTQQTSLIGAVDALLAEYDAGQLSLLP
jgi:hypothetical protein